MTFEPSDYPRGSEWRQWDLHVHTPASFHWKGEKFSPSRSERRDIELVDEMIHALNAAKPAVFAIMDYWSFDGWFALKRRLSQPDSPKLTKMVFPGIELRLCAPMRGRLNAHAIFSDEVEDQALLDFLANLRLEITEQILSDAALRAYARRVGSDKLSQHGFQKSQVDADDNVALLAGQQIAELKADSYKTAIRNAPSGQALGYLPFNTNDGLNRIEVMKHYAYVITLFEASPIFEARDDATWNAFVGRKIPANAMWIDAFQMALGNTPRLPVSGSDSHRFAGVKGDNDKRGYGDFPSGRATWIKADPTWLGLMQAIREPMKRCFIGEIPPKTQTIAANKTFYMESIKFAKATPGSPGDSWFDGCHIPLNSDLIAIIGNKGSGKSALADALALLGNSQQSKHFSFLRYERFRGKSGEPAKQFVGTLNWHGGDPCVANLAEDPSPDRVELVRYIPQGRFELLCNEHVAGKSAAFEKELRSVVFSHIPRESRLDALTFDQLIEEQEKTFRTRLSEERRKLQQVNRNIAAIEEEMHPDIRKRVEEQLKLKERELAEIVGMKPAEVPEPSEELNPEQRDAAEAIKEANRGIGECEARLSDLGSRQSSCMVRKRAATAAISRIRLFRTQFADLKRDLEIELTKLGLSVEDIVKSEIDESKLEKILQDIDQEEKVVGEKIAESKSEIEKLKAVIHTATQVLNLPQQAFQAYTSALKEWDIRQSEVIGAPDLPDSKLGLEARLQQLDSLATLLTKRRGERVAICGQIHDILTEQRNERAALFEPLQKFIADNDLIDPNYDLKFRANLTAFAGTISENLFGIIKQSVGDIRGEDESREAINSRLGPKDINSKKDVLAFLDQVHELLHGTAKKMRPDAYDLRPLLRKDRKAVEVYDYLFGLEYIEPQYTLLFQDTPIEQLSPGQRGALLLIFYLLVDKGRNPIVLDQPEENLDNETIVNLLVPVVNLAKESRQVVMVTHNPNLAVVCDADQIVLAKFDRTSGACISYVSGSIESPFMNRNVVTVLEGTMPAFRNRKEKYHDTVA